MIKVLFACPIDPSKDRQVTPKFIKRHRLEYSVRHHKNLSVNVFGGHLNVGDAMELEVGAPYVIGIRGNASRLIISRDGKSKQSIAVEGMDEWDQLMPPGGRLEFSGDLDLIIQAI